MSPALSSHPLSVQAFLFGDESDSDGVEAFSRSLEERDVAKSAAEGLRHLSGSAVAAVKREIATVAAGVLDLNLTGPLVSGWRKYSNLVSAAERTVAAPGSEEVVVLASRDACRATSWVARTGSAGGRSGPSRQAGSSAVQLCTRLRRPTIARAMPQMATIGPTTAHNRSSVIALPPT
jgi:hypothetical protein